ncbi:hypothetical protein PHSY_003214 [Pseudozyma hubeiensis SY62]|uniref:Uncharacterized protein n=1 Tax=Pseudozyma hubeiensis (strain SY62) TaxID=1305764 RepID=R9P2K5_PSEHS|nr:hypothetical protein PHSY_003214 [Pseudozyma hubeiensis SY62]GAC95638.1 hypothetical protein PHSY_003214 [Pseudozyma hubeiensis SY62]
MAATRARNELAAATAASPTPHHVKHVTSNSEADSVDASSNDQTPARRTTTRTRKLPSRLMPSPSPPPSRPSSLYNAARHAKGGKDDSDSPSTSPAVTPAASAVSSKSRKVAKPDADVASNTGSDHDSAVDRDDAEDLGPGKRKRRPSSMYRPPSTLTTVETPAAPSVLSASKSKKKGRSISPEASAHKSQSPSLAVAQAKHKSRLSKSSRFEAGTPLSRKGDADAFSVLSASHRGDGDDSDADVEAGARTVSKRVRIGDVHDSLDLSPPPLLPRDGSARMQLPMHYSQPTFIRGGRVSVSPEASAKRPVILPAHKRETQPSWKHADIITSSSPVSAGLAKFEGDAGAPLTYVPLRDGVRGMLGFRDLHAATLTKRASTDEQEADDIEQDEDEEDDENDFHQAMLDADFDFFDSQPSDPSSAKSLWPASRRGTTEEAEMDDTPATTPRSPLSGCDLPSPDSPRCKTEEEDVAMSSVEDKAASFRMGRDSVFAHALPTTQVGADKPHRHAGSLTLSLPYDPAVVASSPNLHAVDLGSAAASTTKRGNYETGQIGTPVLQRRKHAGLPTGPHALAPLKLGAELMERSNSNALPYMQLSPMIEMDSPLLSPGLTLSLHTKVTDLPSPFLMGVGPLADLEQPAPLDLPPADGSTTPKHSVSEVLAPETGTAVAKSEDVTVTPAAKQPEVKATESSKEAPAKAEKPSTRRPALPPPRQIRFTTFTTPSVEPNDNKPQQPEATTRTTPLVHPKQQQITQHQLGAGATASSPSSDPTPDLVQSGSPESASDSLSPMSQSDSASSGDAEVETILFGPPEKLDLHELDHAWNGSKAGLQHEAALRRAGASQVGNVSVDSQ